MSSPLFFYLIALILCPLAMLILYLYWRKFIQQELHRRAQQQSLTNIVDNMLVQVQVADRQPRQSTVSGISVIIETHSDLIMPSSSSTRSSSPVINALTYPPRVFQEAGRSSLHSEQVSGTLSAEPPGHMDLYGSGVAEGSKRSKGYILCIERGRRIQRQDTSG